MDRRKRHVIRESQNKKYIESVKVVRKGNKTTNDDKGGR